MKRIFCFFLLSLTLSSCNQKNVTYTSWYVSNARVGNGSANSWDNAQLLSSFNWGAVSAGDTIYIDGGTDSLIYDYSESGYSFYPEAAGTPGNKIVITRGKDTGHNGRPIFMGSNTQNCAIVEENYVEVNNLVFKNGATDGGGVMYIAGTTGVDIFNCEIWHPRCIGITVQANDTRIIGNTIKTGVVSNGYATDGMWIGGGAASQTDVGGGIYGGIEIAHNYILDQNTGGMAHKDALQITMRWQEVNGGTTKIHHNFIAAIPTSPATNSNLPYIDDGAAGHYEMYNNIFVMKNYIDAGGYGVFFGDQQYLGMWVKCYNNTMYMTGCINIVPWKFYDIDSLDFRNNVTYSVSSWVAIGIDYYTENQGSYFNCDYNQYQIDDQGEFAYLQEDWNNHPLGNSQPISWSMWKTRMIADVNGKFTTFSFAGGSEFSPNSYKLNNGSSGINEGTALTLFSDDYEGNPRRIGDTWDVGAFEYK